MKPLILVFFPIFVFLAANVSFAGSVYTCDGQLIDGRKTESAHLTIEFDSAKHVRVTDEEETEYDLDLSKSNSRYRTFGDYEWDGYGGSIELRIPAKPSSKFKARFVIESYSEAGHVGTTTFSGDCSKSND